jgi:hypothetical protein
MGLTFLYGSVSPPVALGAVRLPDERFANHWAPRRGSDADRQLIDEE